jgi:hypothetical protein
MRHYIGDIAMYPQPGTGEMRRIEHWNVSRSLILIIDLLFIVLIRSLVTKVVR